MIDMALLSVLRRWNFRDGMPIREITRRSRLSRNTVRKFLASGELEPRYRRSMFPSKRDEYEPTLTRPSERWHGRIGWSGEGLNHISANHFSQRQHLHGRI
jgi:hypothetical protein